MKKATSGLALALAFVLAGWMCPGGGVAAGPRVLKISHQFPGGTAEKGDFRDRLVRIFAQEVEQKTNGELKFEIYPSGSLVKAKQQFDAMANGSLDMSLYPLAYSGGKIPQTNITLMPCLITSYDQGLRWKDAPIGKALTKLLDDKGVEIITWVWQAGGIVSKEKPIIVPKDVEGLKIRGAGKSMDIMLRAAGGAIASIPSSEVYNALQQGVLDAAVTSSASLMSFRLYEQAKNVTTPRKHTFWFMFEPLLMSKATFDSLTPEQQKVVRDVGTSLEKFAKEAAQEDDQELAKVYAKGGAQVHDMDDAAFKQWRAVSKASAWKDFADKVKDGQHWMDMAEAVE